MNNEIFKTSYAGFKVIIYPNRLEFKKLFQKNTIPINQIASVELGIPMHAKVTIETTGGKKYKIPVMLGDKTKLRDAIFQAQAGGGNGGQVQSSNLDELKKLSDLKENGTITQEEFDQQKQKLLS